MSTEEADTLLADSSHFAKAVTDLGDRQPLLTTRAIFNAQGIKLAEQGTAVNGRMYERLVQHRLAVPLEESVAGSFSVDADHLREAAEVQLLQVPVLARMLEDTRLRAQLLDSVAKVPLPAAVAFQLTLVCEAQPERFAAAVRTALLAAWLSTGPTALRFDIGMAAAAGLLHDVGMLHLDPVLLRPAHDLSAAQQRQLYSHPLVSTLLLQRHSEYSKEAVRAVTEHHEHLDGSGYPRGLAGDQISPLGQVLALAEVVAAMLSPDRVAAELRLSVLLRMNAHRFNPLLVQRVMQLLRPQDEPVTAQALLLDDPVGLLCDVDDALCGWPHEAAGTAAALPREQAQEVAMLAAQVAQLRRTLANVGAARAQLTLLHDDEELDAPLQTELSLLAREAAWQLRSVTRQARRRWRDETAPAGGMLGALRDWLNQAETVVVQGMHMPAPTAALAA